MFTDEKKLGEAQVVKPKTELQQWCADAADFLETHNWLRSKLYLGTNDNPVAVCMWGALYFTNKQFFNSSKHSDALQKRARHYLGMASVRWNDRVATSKEEVVAFLRKLADDGEL